MHGVGEENADLLAVFVMQTCAISTGPPTNPPPRLYGARRRRHRFRDRKHGIGKD
jgi:hypothetical protein